MLVRKSPRMPKCNGSTFPSRYAHSGEGTTPLLDPPSSSSYERLSMRKYSGSLPLEQVVEMLKAKMVHEGITDVSR